MPSCADFAERLPSMVPAVTRIAREIGDLVIARIIERVTDKKIFRYLPPPVMRHISPFKNCLVTVTKRTYALGTFSSGRRGGGREGSRRGEEETANPGYYQYVISTSWCSNIPLTATSKGCWVRSAASVTAYTFTNASPHTRA